MKTIVWLGLVAACVGCAAPAEVESGDDFAETTEDALHGAATRATLRSSSTLFGGKRTTLELRVTTASGAAVTSFEEEHTKLLHLIVVSHDLSYFTHVHPVHVGQGRFRIDWTPSAVEDDYTIYAQYRPTGAADLVTARFSAHVPATSIKAAVPVTEATAPVTTNGSVLTIASPSTYPVGASTVRFQVTNAADGQPAALGTFLGARAHVIAVKAQSQGAVFLHGHDGRSTAQAATGAGGHGGHGASAPPVDPHAAHGGAAGPAAPGELAFDLSFPQAGLYRLWVQYRHGSKDITQAVTVRVGAAPTCSHDAPGRSYVGHSTQECSLMRLTCVPGSTYFADACGCGCATNTP